MSKVLESLDLRTRLDNLYESLSDNNGMTKAIVEKYIGYIGVHPEYNILVGVCNEMKAYDWLAPVDEFIKESYKFAEDHQLSFAVLNTLESIRTSKDKASFQAAINALEEIKDLNEGDLSKEVPSKLKKHSWIPGVRQLVEFAEGLSKSNKTTDKRFSNSSPISPIMENENGETIFHVGRRVYAMNEDEEIRLVSNNEINENFAKLIQLSEKFTHSSEGLRMRTNNCVIDLVINEGEDTKVFVDSQEVKPSQLSAHLTATGKFRYGQYDTIKVLEHALNSSDNLYELDFVETIKSNVYEGVEVNLLKTANGVYVNKINPAMNENILIKPESAKDAVNLVQEFIDYDITNSVQDLLEGEAEEIALKAKAEKEIYERIDYIKDEISKLSELGMDDMEDIKEAKKILNDALEAQQAKLNSLFKSKSVTVHEASDADYVPGEIKMKTNGYAPGTKVQINAGQFTSGGGKDMIDVILPSNQIVQIQKKYIDATI